MPTPNVWRKVGIDVESALGAAKTITAISKVTEAVVTATHDFAIGDYVRMIGIAGMQQLDEVVARVKSVSTTVSFVLEGVDSTLFDTFTSGTVKKITFGTAMSTVQEISSSGGDAQYTPTTTVHSERDTQIPSGENVLVYTMNNIFDPADVGLLALRAASRAKTSLAIKFNFSTGAKICFGAFISAPLTPTGSTGAVVQTPVSFSVRALPTPYST